MIGFHCVSKIVLVGEHLLDAVPIFAKNKASIIPNQLGGDFYRPERHSTREELREILFIGRISKAKGVDDLICAATELPEINFKLLGPLTEYAPMIQGELPSNVTVFGFDKDVEKHMRMADAMIFPSRSEGMPYAVLEAAALGLPMIVSKIAAHEEISRRIGDMIFYVPGRVDELVSRICEIKPSSVRARLSMKLYEDSKIYNDQQNYCCQYLKILTSV